MYAMLQYLISSSGTKFLKVVDWSTGNDMLWLILTEAILFHLLGWIRKYIVKRVENRLGFPLPENFIYIYLYALACRAAGTVLLLLYLWQLPYMPGTFVYMQLLILSVGICELMGIAVPWSALRFAVVLWYQRRYGLRGRK